MAFNPVGFWGKSARLNLGHPGRFLLAGSSENRTPGPRILLGGSFLWGDQLRGIFL
jgi:hypothetical protein